MRFFPVIAVAALALACGLFHPALAGGWSVGPIAAKSGGQSGYCSMKGVYPGGQAVVFARDVAGVNSIAVDFGEDILSAGARYPATVTVGEAVRELPGVAASPRILLLSPGYDGAFYEMVARKDAMEVSVAQKTARFGLEGSAVALRDLEACATELSLKEARYAAPARRAATPARSVISVKRAPETPAAPAVTPREVEQLRADNRALRLENEAIRARAQAEAVRRENLEREKEARAALERERALLSSRNEALRAELAGTREGLAALENSLARRRGEEQALKDDLQTLEEENARLQRMLAEVQDQLSAARQRELQAAALRAENESRRLSRIAPAAGGGAGDFVRPAAPAAPATGESRIGRILAAARVAPDGGLAPSYEGGAEVYSWQVDGLFGAAETAPRDPAASFGDLAAAYFAKMQQRCGNDFAYALGDVRRHGALAVQKAEMACIGTDGESAAAALLFVDDGRDFTIITHEGAPAQIGSAMSRRDMVATAAASSSSS